MMELKLKEDEVYEMNYVHTLNWLSYFKNIEDIKDKNKL